MTIRTHDELLKLLSKTELDQSPYLPTRFVPKFVSLIDDELKPDLSTDRSRREACEMINIWLKEHDYKCEGFRSKKTDSIMHEITVSYHENVRTFDEANKGIMGKDSFGFQFKDADDGYNDWIFIAWDLFKGGEAKLDPGADEIEPDSPDVTIDDSSISNYEYLMENGKSLEEAIKMWKENSNPESLEFQGWLDLNYTMNARFNKYDIFKLSEDDPKLYIIRELKPDCYVYSDLSTFIEDRLTEIQKLKIPERPFETWNYSEENKMRRIGHLEFDKMFEISDEDTND